MNYSDHPLVIAIHEVGHATARVLQGGKLGRRGLRAKSWGDANGIAFYKKTTKERSPDWNIKSAAIEKRIIDALAGPMSEYRFNRTAGADGDVQTIAYLLSDLETKDQSAPNNSASHFFTMQPWRGFRNLCAANDPTYPATFAQAKRQATLMSNAVYALIQTENPIEALKLFQPATALEVVSTVWFSTLGRLTEKTAKFLDENWNTIERVAKVLAERGNIGGTESTALIKGLPYDPAVDKAWADKQAGRRAAKSTAEKEKKRLENQTICQMCGAHYVECIARPHDGTGTAEFVWYMCRGCTTRTWTMYSKNPDERIDWRKRQEGKPTEVTWVVVNDYTPDPKLIEMFPLPEPEESEADADAN